MIDLKYIIQCHFFTLVGLELIKNDVERVFCDFRKIDFRANFGPILKEKLKKWTNYKTKIFRDRPARWALARRYVVTRRAEYDLSCSRVIRMRGAKQN